MHFPRYWARAESGPAVCWGWSDTSPADAESKARRRAEDVESKLKFQELSKRSEYGYPKQPLREEVVQELSGGGENIGAVTRNGYGALVLNTAQVMFLDVDLPEQKVGFLSRLFGRQTASTNPAETSAVEKIEAWCSSNRRWGMRLYRTAAGLRVLVTHELFNPAQLSRERVCDALGVDPLYIKLCESQESFRARLTPKPWRCGCATPPHRWPWRDAAAEEKFRKWAKRYAERCEQLATCALVKEIGSRDIHRDVRQILALHDEQTKALSGLALA